MEHAMAASQEWTNLFIDLVADSTYIVETC